MDKHKIQSEIDVLLYFKKLIEIKLKMLRFELQYDEVPEDLINKK